MFQTSLKEKSVKVEGERALLRQNTVIIIIVIIDYHHHHHRHFPW